MTLATQFASRPPQPQVGVRAPRSRMRRDTFELLQDADRLLKATALSFGRVIAGLEDELLANARAAFRARAPEAFGFNILAEEPFARHVAEVAELLAAAEAAGRLRTRKQAAEEDESVDPGLRAFAETFPRNLAAERLADYIRSLPVVERARFEEFVRRHQRQAFTLAGVEQREALRALRDLLAQSIRTGLTPEQFDRVARELLRNFQVRGGRLRTVWNDTLTNTIRAGRRAELGDSAVAGALQLEIFDAINDFVVRPNHRALDNAIAPVEWWQAHLNLRPPLGFNCRCQLFPVGETRAERLVESGQVWRIDQRRVPAGAGEDAGFVKLAA